MKRTVLMAALVLLPLCAWAQEPERLDSVVVSTTRAGEHTPVAYSSLNKAELRSASPANSLPMTLSLLPSVVTYNEGGTGLGNSSMTIRGLRRRAGDDEQPHGADRRDPRAGMPP